MRYGGGFREEGHAGGTALGVAPEGSGAFCSGDFEEEDG